ncbi:hypothetical protein BOSE21B_10830 [Bosea sp. 21B]|nr:hypothetical protein BOSE21B_10830 [Bosea sp. 21B]
MRLADQVLPDLDQRVEQTAARRMAVDRVARQAAIIGFVVADDQIALRLQRRDQRLREAPFPVPEHAGMPGPWHALPERREGVQRDDRRRVAGSDRRLDRGVDRGVIGRVIARDPFGDPGFVDPGIARHDRAVGDPHHQSRIVAAAIGIDQQAREIAEHGRSAQRLRHRPRHLGRSDIVGDVAFELLRRQAEQVQLRRDRIGRMVAKQQDAARRIPRDDLDIAGLPHRSTALQVLVRTHHDLGPSVASRAAPAQARHSALSPRPERQSGKNSRCRNILEHVLIANAVSTFAGHALVRGR